MSFYVIGPRGSDAGYWYWDGHSWVHVGGWGVDQLAEVSAAINIMVQATRLKKPGLAEAATKTVADFVQNQLAAHVKASGGVKEGGGVVIIAAQ
jgi:hypothetical protein